MSHSRNRPAAPGFQIVDYLGSGARSTIWRVRDRRTNRLYALKQVIRQPGDDHRYLNQAINEFTIARQFDHPAIRRYERMKKLRQWLSVSGLQLFMELCEGTNCQANRPADLTQAATIFLAVARAMAHMHARGYIHGDIKPNNIIVAPDGTVKIIDFGQSCRIGTIKERIQGTPDFIAPEQVHRRPLDGRTDLFNFGAALYWTLTGKPIPTVLPKKTDGIQLVSDMNVIPPEQINEDVPASLSKLVMDCVDPQPSRRPANAKEVVSRLDLIVHTLVRANGAIAE